jgi:uncharacterized protein
MVIGLLSDTHSFLDQKVLQYFSNCDEVWHAGDIGDKSVLHQLESVKPVRAVYGNIDDREMQAILPEDLRFNCEGLNIWMTHIGGTPPNYNPRVKKILRTDTPDIFICGHSHILAIKRDPQMSNMLFINPGAAGNQGFHSMKTLVRFEIINAAVTKMEVIELGKRGALN